MNRYGKSYVGIKGIKAHFLEKNSEHLASHIEVARRYSQCPVRTSCKICGQKIQFENSFSHIGCAHNVDFKDFGLQMSLIWSIVLESFKKECSAFLNLVEFKEHMGHLINVGFGRSIVSICYHFCKTDSSLSVNWHNLSKNFDKIWNMTCLLAVWHDLIKLIGLNQSLNNFVW